MQNRDKLYIDGQWIASTGNRTINVINPATEELIGRIPAATRDDADRAVAAARAAGLIGGFPDRTFRPAAAVTRAQVAVLLQRARQICGNPPHSGCAAPLGPEDRTLLGAGLVSPMNAYTRSYRGGQVEVTYVTPVQQVWSVLVQGEGATPRGVAIGDSAATVRRAYGPQVELRNGALTYSAGAAYDYFYIRFAIVEGKVHSILLSQSK